jgi:5'-deoxynucleotidase YfbR-like HD superfamily hydrolase
MSIKSSHSLSSEHIRSEIKKLQYTYGLNKVIRYNLKREEKHQTQSVAEHVTNILHLAYYFRDLEDPMRLIDFDKVVRIILVHDMGEIETGDIVCVSKTQEDFDEEEKAIQEVKIKTPRWISEEIEELFAEFENPKTIEGFYAKAIDKFEGKVFWADKKGVEMTRDVNNVLGIPLKDVFYREYEKIFKILEKTPFRIIEAYLHEVKEEAIRNGALE